MKQCHHRAEQIKTTKEIDAHYQLTGRVRFALTTEVGWDSQRVRFPPRSLSFSHNETKMIIKASDETNNHDDDDPYPLALVPFGLE